ncbi:hypothetical protein FKM82_030133 [Ascaphus truei]
MVRAWEMSPVSSHGERATLRSTDRMHCCVRSRACRESSASALCMWPAASCRAGEVGRSHLSPRSLCCRPTQCQLCSRSCTHSDLSSADPGDPRSNHLRRRSAKSDALFTRREKSRVRVRRWRWRVRRSRRAQCLPGPADGSAKGTFLCARPSNTCSR